MTRLPPSRRVREGAVEDAIAAALAAARRAETEAPADGPEFFVHTADGRTFKRPAPRDP